MLQWPPFQFFDKQLVKDPETDQPPSIFKLDIVCCASGRGSIIFGDAEGFINIVNREFKARAFQAYDLNVKHMQQLKTQNVLLTIGADSMENPTESILRIWNLDKEDKTGNPLCLKTLKLDVRYAITKISSTEDLTHIAIGLMDGSVILIYGDIVRQKSPKQLVIRNPDEIPITGLGWHEGWQGGNALYVVTPARVQSYVFQDTLRVTNLDDFGAELDCSCLSDQSYMIVAQSSGQAIYNYNPDDRGGCLAFQGEKKMISFFRSHLIVVWAAENNGQQFNTVNIYDLKNRFTAFDGRFQNVRHVIAEWGTIFILTADGKAFQLEEKDTQTKLETLFRKKLYSVAINLAVGSLDPAAIIEIYKKYGDYLYGQKEYDSAMAQYLKTIGGLEPSYVIQRFLNSQQIHNLTLFLQALHERNKATPDHTTLLLNCYTKLKDENKINEFIHPKSPYKFAVETAIKVCRQAGYYKQSMYLAKLHRQHDMVLRILLEDLKQHAEALRYIHTLDFFEAEKNIKQYGKDLMAQVPEETTKLLMELCSTYSPITDDAESLFALDTKANAGLQQLTAILEDMSFIEGAAANRAHPAEFIHIFINHPDWLVKFLEFIVEQEDSHPSSDISHLPLIYDTLFEMYLREDDSSDLMLDQVRKQREKQQKALALLMNPNAVYNENHVLVLAQMHNFKQGVIYLYERANMYNEILEYHMERNEYADILLACKRHGDKDLNLWIHALAFFASRDDNQCEEEIREVLNNVEKNQLLPPLLVIQILAQRKTATLSVVKDYIIDTLKAANHKISENKREIREISEETKRMRHEIEQLKTSAKIFHISKCFSCQNQLDLHSTSVHFLCMHSFHQRCLGENEQQCPKCLPENKRVLEVKRMLEESANQHDTFLKQLDCSADGFSSVADYFGRGIFSASATSTSTSTRAYDDH